MASLTSFRGRRCTKVRRAISPLNASTATSQPTPKSTAVQSQPTSIANPINSTNAAATSQPTSKPPAISQSNALVAPAPPQVTNPPAQVSSMSQPKGRTTSVTSTVITEVTTTLANKTPVAVPGVRLPAGLVDDQPAVDNTQPQTTSVPTPKNATPTTPKAQDPAPTEPRQPGGAKDPTAVPGVRIPDDVVGGKGTTTTPVAPVVTPTQAGIRVPTDLVPDPSPNQQPTPTPVGAAPVPVGQNSDAAAQRPPANDPSPLPQTENKTVLPQPALTEASNSQNTPVAAPIPAPIAQQPSQPSDAPGAPQQNPPVGATQGGALGAGSAQGGPGNGGSVGGIGGGNGGQQGQGQGGGPIIVPGVAGSGNAPNEPRISQGVGPFSADVFTPAPVVFTSAGIVQTSILPPTTRPGPSLPTNLAESPPFPTTTPGQNAEANSNQHHGKSGKNTAVIAGVVSTLAVIALLCGFFFLMRRKRRNVRESVSSGVFASSRNPRDRMRSFFTKSESRVRLPNSPRASSPALESGLGGRRSMREVDNPRRRSSSEPAGRRPFAAAAALGAAAPAMKSTQPPVLPKVTTPQEHRRSVSSLGGFAYPVFSDTNNPFLDHDPSDPLHVTNPNASSNNTPATTPGITPGITTKFGTVAAFGDAAGIVAAGYNTFAKPAPKQPNPPSPTKQFGHQRAGSAAQNPFRDPEPLINPFADPSSDAAAAVGGAAASRGRHSKKISESSVSDFEEYSLTRAAGQYGYKRTSQTRIPLMSKTAPSPAASVARYRDSDDSGFHSASPNSDVIASGAASGGGLGLLGLWGKKANAIKDGEKREVPTSAPAPRPPLPRIPSNTRVSHQRLSSNSDASSSLSISFPSSWGTPGPTRPGSFATQHGGRQSTRQSRPSFGTRGSGGANSGTSPTERGRSGSDGNSGSSRVSDPFDLDVPELLQYANSDAGYSAVTLNNPPGAPGRRY